MNELSEEDRDLLLVELPHLLTRAGIPYGAAADNVERDLRTALAACEETGGLLGFLVDAAVAFIPFGEGFKALGKTIFDNRAKLHLGDELATFISNAITHEGTKSIVGDLSKIIGKAGLGSMQDGGYYSASINYIQLSKDEFANQTGYLRRFIENYGHDKDLVPDIILSKLFGRWVEDNNKIALNELIIRTNLEMYQKYVMTVGLNDLKFAGMKIEGKIFLDTIEADGDQVEVVPYLLTTTITPAYSGLWDNSKRDTRFAIIPDAFRYMAVAKAFKTKHVINNPFTMIDENNPWFQNARQFRAADPGNTLILKKNVHGEFTTDMILGMNLMNKSSFDMSPKYIPVPN